MASSYGNIVINGNTFQAFEPGVGGASIFGVYMKNFDGPLTGLISDSINSGTITIGNNTFLDTNNHNTNAPDENCPSSAICLENSTAWVLENTIEDKGYACGLTNWATTYGTDRFPHNSGSFICSNLISGLKSYSALGGFYAFGVYSSYYHGYFKLNTITNCDDGYVTYGKDQPMFVADSIIGNQYNTLIIQNGSTVDMSGIHSADSSGTDAAGFNTIVGPSEPETGTSQTGLIVLQNLGPNNIILANSSELWNWQNFGKNNIFVSPRDTTSENQPIIQNQGIPLHIQISNIDSNYFGGRNPASGLGYTAGCSVSPCTDGCGTDTSKWNSADANEIDALNINYCASSGGTKTSGIIPRPFFGVGNNSRMMHAKGKTLNLFPH